MSIFLSCGEASGDVLMAQLASALIRLKYSGKLWGMAGDLASDVGVEKTWDSSNLQIMGVGAALRALPRLNSLADHMVDAVLKNNPEAVVLIDSPDFHIPLAKRVKKKGYRGKMIYLAPPTVWAWRSGRVVPLRNYFDLVLPLFGFEHAYLVKRGVLSRWRGHPMVDSFDKSLPPMGNRVALLPGSRSLEVRLLTPVLVDIARELKKEGFEPVFSIAPGLRKSLKSELARSLDGFEICRDPGRELLASSAFAVGASGTVAVEAMMCDRFMVVLYKAHLLEWFIYDNFISLPHISIPNILAGGKIYPELLQSKANFESTMSAIWRYVGDDDYQQSVHRGLSLARSRMGASGASMFWARSLLRLISR